jgi:hypothetical protein
VFVTHIDLFRKMLEPVPERMSVEFIGWKTERNDAGRIRRQP